MTIVTQDSVANHIKPIFCRMEFVIPHINQFLEYPPCHTINKP